VVGGPSASEDGNNEDSGSSGADPTTTTNTTVAMTTSTDTGTTPTGACCTPHDTPGCDNAAVSACVCAGAPACCTGPYDASCVAAVDQLGCGVCTVAETSVDDITGATDGIACGFTPDDPPCKQCLEAACCEQYTACVIEPTCECLIACQIEGNDLATCIDKCGTKGFPQQVIDLGKCSENNCSDVCPS
jgi:hypothetical protein